MLFKSHYKLKRQTTEKNCMHNYKWSSSKLDKELLEEYKEEKTPHRTIYGSILLIKKYKLNLLKGYLPFIH